MDIERRAVPLQNSWASCSSSLNTGKVPASIDDFAAIFIITGSKNWAEAKRLLKIINDGTTFEWVGRTFRYYFLRIWSFNRIVNRHYGLSKSTYNEQFTNSANWLFDATDCIIVFLCVVEITVCTTGRSLRRTWKVTIRMLMTLPWYWGYAAEVLLLIGLTV